MLLPAAWPTIFLAACAGSATGGSNATAASPAAAAITVAAVSAVSSLHAVAPGFIAVAAARTPPSSFRVCGGPAGGRVSRPSPSHPSLAAVHHARPRPSGPGPSLLHVLSAPRLLGWHLARPRGGTALVSPRSVGTGALLLGWRAPHARVLHNGSIRPLCVSRGTALPSIRAGAGVGAVPVGRAAIGRADVPLSWVAFRAHRRLHNRSVPPALCSAVVDVLRPSRRGRRHRRGRRLWRGRRRAWLDGAACRSRAASWCSCTLARGRQQRGHLQLDAAQLQRRLAHEQRFLGQLDLHSLPRAAGARGDEALDLGDGVLVGSLRFLVAAGDGVVARRLHLVDQRAAGAHRRGYWTPIAADAINANDEPTQNTGMRGRSSATNQTVLLHPVHPRCRRVAHSRHPWRPRGNAATRVPIRRVTHTLYFKS